MNDPIVNPSALRDPRNRTLLITVGAALLALILVVAIWQSTGPRGASRDLARANDRIAEKQREVDDARRNLEQKVSELRALRADADVQATRLEGAVDQQVTTAAGDVRLDPNQVYYVRDRNGRFVPVRP